MTLLYKCNKCGTIAKAAYGNNLPDDWGFKGDSDICPDCLVSYRELEKAHASTWEGKIEAWFKEIK